MRLSDEEVRAIKASAIEAFGEPAVVRVFGSRLDDRRRGGDIDLHIDLPTDQPVLAATALFRELLNKRVGEREYDILVSQPGQSPSSVCRKAMAEGVVL